MVQIVSSLAIGNFFRLAPVSLTCLHTPVERKVNDGEKEEVLERFVEYLNGRGSSNVVAVASTFNRGLDS